MEVGIKGLECKRCGHKWYPRKQIVLVCPHCKSPYWNLPKGDKVVKKCKNAQEAIEYLHETSKNKDTEKHLEPKGFTPYSKEKQTHK